MNRVLVSDPRTAVRALLAERLGGSATAADPAGFGAVVYHPPARRAAPDVEGARRFLGRCAEAGVRRVVLLSSTAVYGANWHNPGLIAEDKVGSRSLKNPIARAWLAVEQLAADLLGGDRLSVLRAATVPVADDTGPLRGVFRRWVSASALGHDPSVQLLAPSDLAAAVELALARPGGGPFNVVPAGVMPLRQAARLAGSVRLPLAAPTARAAYLRYNWTASGAGAAEALGFTPARTSAEALHDARVLDTGQAPRRWPKFAGRAFDDFGFDPAYHRRVGRALARFLEKAYWRVETRGFEKITASGPAVLVGVHRGFMPFDGVIFSHQVTRAAGRTPRFLIHPGLVKFPGLHDFMTKQGGFLATAENTDYALGRGELLALFPEGVRGPFRHYRDAYTLGKFGRDEYVRAAIRHRAPIVPFVTVGSAEIFPILARVEWGWWKRHTEWPCFPITPTFPLLPVPLPSKWHTLVLDPVRVDLEYPPSAADDDRTVRSVGRAIRQQMQETLTRLRGLRRSVFYGSIFAEEGPEPVPAVPAEVGAEG